MKILTIDVPVYVSPARMQRRHYVIIAQCVAREITDNTIRYEAAHNLADYLEAANPRFDKAKFLKACNV